MQLRCKFTVYIQFIYDIISIKNTYIPSFSNVEALGLLRLLTNSSNLKCEGFVALKMNVAILQQLIKA